MPTTTIPDVIYLQWYAEDGEYAEDVTWCVDRIHETDIEYCLTQLGPAIMPDDAGQERDVGLLKPDC